MTAPLKTSPSLIMEKKKSERAESSTDSCRHYSPDDRANLRAAGSSAPGVVRRPGLFMVMFPMNDYGEIVIPQFL